MRKLPALGALVLAAGLLTPGIAADAQPYLPENEPVPIPHARPHGLPPVPIPHVRPHGPKPVPMPHLEEPVVPQLRLPRR